jgi:hypothetical protein
MQMPRSGRNHQTGRTGARPTATAGPNFASGSNCPLRVNSFVLRVGSEVLWGIQPDSPLLLERLGSYNGRLVEELESLPGEYEARSHMKKGGPGGERPDPWSRSSVKQPTSVERRAGL